MQNRTAAVVITAITALVCLCAAIFACVFGAFGVMGQPFDTTLNGVPTGSAPMPTWLGVLLLCLSVVFIAVPVVVGFLTLRQKPAAAPIEPQEPIPPAN